MSRAVRYDPDVIQAEFQQILVDLVDPFTTDSARNALGKQQLPTLREGVDAARARLDNPFTLMVLGDFKRGKSTLINALIGEQLLTSDVTPETVTINPVSWGSSHDFEAVLNDGGTVSLERNELKSEQLARILPGLPAPVDHLRLRSPTRWLEGLKIVDTPGLSDLMGRFDAQVQAFLPKADAIIYVVSALSPLSESERAFLQGHIRPQGYPKLMFVVNMLDALPSRDDEVRVLGSVRTKIHLDFPGATVMGVSALDELCRTTGLERPDLDRADQHAERFDELRAHLRNNILLNRDLLQIARSLSHAKGVARQQGLALQRLSAAMASSQAALDHAITERKNQDSALHTQIKEKKQSVKRKIEGLSLEAGRWMDGFLDRLRDEAVAPLHSMPYGDVQRYFPFFFSDRVREALAKCFDAHQPIILEELEKAGEDLVTAMSQGPTALDRSISTASFEPTQWSFVDNFYLLGALGGVARFLFVDGIGRLLSSSTERSAEPSGRSAAFQRKVEAAFPEIRKMAYEQIKGTYADLARKVDLELDTWYRTELDATLSALEQAKTLRELGRAEGESAAALLTELLAHVERSIEQLDDLQEKLEHSNAVEALLT